MVDALASDRSNQPFGEAVLPRRAWSDRFVADAHGTQSVPSGSAIDLSFPEILSAWIRVMRQNHRITGGLYKGCCSEHTYSAQHDLEAQLEQLTMNAWCAPESVCAAHLANERAQLHRDLRSANTVARPPAPIRPKAGTVPANDRLRPDNRNRAKDGGKPAIEPNKQKTIGIVEVRSFRRPSAKHIDLLP